MLKSRFLLLFGSYTWEYWLEYLDVSSKGIKGIHFLIGGDKLDVSLKAGQVEIYKWQVSISF